MQKIDANMQINVFVIVFFFLTIPKVKIYLVSSKSIALLQGWLDHLDNEVDLEAQ